MASFVLVAASASANDNAYKFRVMFDTDHFVFGDADGAHWRLNLLNIPLSPLYRYHLRVYTLNPIKGAEVLVRIYSQPSGDRGVILARSNDPDRMLRELVLSTTAPEGSFPFSENFPGFAATTNLPVGGYEGSSVRIELVPLLNRRLGNDRFTVSYEQSGW